MLDVKKYLMKVADSITEINTARRGKEQPAYILTPKAGFVINRYTCIVKNGMVFLNVFVHKNGAIFSTPREIIGDLNQGYLSALYISTECTGSNGLNMHANRSVGVIVGVNGDISVDAHSSDVKQAYIYLAYPLKDT